MELMLHRTNLKEGAIDAYRRIHSRIPPAFEEALRGAGVRQWSIWRDGNHLIHVIDTEFGLDEMGRRIAALGSIDPEWEALIAPLGEEGPDNWARLEPIWLMTDAGQASGAEVYAQGARPSFDADAAPATGV